MSELSAEILAWYHAAVPANKCRSLIETHEEAASKLRYKSTILSRICSADKNRTFLQSYTILLHCTQQLFNVLINGFCPPLYTCIANTFSYVAIQRVYMERCPEFFLDKKSLHAYPGACRWLYAFEVKRTCSDLPNSRQPASAINCGDRCMRPSIMIVLTGSLATSCRYQSWESVNWQAIAFSLKCI